MPDNTVTLVGNVTRDPEIRFTTGGRGVASFGLAVNRRWQSNGEWQEQTSFFDIVCWGTLGENCAQSLSKGSRAIVYGRLEQRSKIEVIADEVGPSMRWATADVVRNERTTAAAGGEQPSDRGAPPANPEYAGEEPF